MSDKFKLPKVQLSYKWMKKNMKTGDCFDEMLSWYMFIVKRDKKEIIVAWANPPCEFPKDAKFMRFKSFDEFFEKKSYSSSTKKDESCFPFCLGSRDHNVDDWLNNAKIEDYISKLDRIKLNNGGGI